MLSKNWEEKQGLVLNLQMNNLIPNCMKCISWISSEIPTQPLWFIIEVNRFIARSTNCCLIIMFIASHCFYHSGLTIDLFFYRSQYLISFPECIIHLFIPRKMFLLLMEKRIKRSMFKWDSTVINVPILKMNPTSLTHD